MHDLRAKRLLSRLSPSVEISVVAGVPYFKFWVKNDIRRSSHLSNFLQRVGGSLDHRRVEYPLAEVRDDGRARLLEDYLLAPLTEGREEEAGTGGDGAEQAAGVQPVQAALYEAA